MPSHLIVTTIPHHCRWLSLVDWLMTRQAGNALLPLARVVLVAEDGQKRINKRDPHDKVLERGTFRN